MNGKRIGVTAFDGAVIFRNDEVGIWMEICVRGNAGIDEDHRVGIAFADVIADAAFGAALVEPETCNAFSVAVVDLTDQPLEEFHAGGSVLIPAHFFEVVVVDVVFVVRREIEHQRDAVFSETVDQLPDHVGGFRAFVRTSGGFHGFRREQKIESGVRRREYNVFRAEIMRRFREFFAVKQRGDFFRRGCRTEVVPGIHRAAVVGSLSVRVII